MSHRRSALTGAIAVAVWCSACGGGGGDSVQRITMVGMPSPDLPVPPVPAALFQPSCAANPDRAGVGVWKPMSVVGAPLLVDASLWTGAELVVANTSGDPPPSVSVYDPVLDRWRDLSPPDGVSLKRLNPYLGFVAGKLVVYGGIGSGIVGVLSDGWTIDLATETWTAMAVGPTLMAPLNDGLQHVFAAQTRALFLPVNDPTAIATYDLATGVWATVPLPPSTPGGGCFSPAWNGRTGMCGSLDYLFVVTADPLAFTPFPKLLDDSALIVSTTPVGDRFFAWAYALTGAVPSQYRAFWIDPAGQSWGAAASVPPRQAPLLATVNGRVLVWGGRVDGVASPLNDGAVLDPATGTWSAITCVGAPTPASGLRAIVPTSTGLIVFSGNRGSSGNAVLEL